jgi:hypothetical protein
MLLILLFIAGSPSDLRAAPYEGSLSRDDKLSLARNFVGRLKGKLNESPAPSNETEPDTGLYDSTLSFVPDGQSLLLRPKVKNAVYDFDIFTLKQNGRMYLSFYDMIETLGLAIEYDAESDSASGWFLREDWPILIDFNSGNVQARGEAFSLDPDDVILEEGERLIAGDSLGQWLDMGFQYDISHQYLEIMSAYPLPGIARLERQKLKPAGQAAVRTAILPEITQEKSNFDITTADVSLRTNYRSVDKGETRKSHQANLMLQGDLLKHDAYMQTTYKRQTEGGENGIQNVTARLTRREQDPVLLGALKARAYTIGDTGTPSIPLTGQSGQELGFRVTNNPVERINYTDTKIRGDALPDWDVELYRNGVLIGLQTVEEDGRYSFENVTLFSGDNNFELFFYGPQGEIRLETISIPLSREVLQAQNNIYDVSVSLEDKQVYRLRESGDEDEGKLHAAARYNFLMGDTLGYAGLRSRSLGSKQKTFLSAGAANIWNGYFVDTNAAIDDQGELGGQIAVRKSFGRLNTRLNTEFRTDEFSPEGSTNPPVVLVEGALETPVPDIIGRNSHMSLSARQANYADDSQLRQGHAAFGTKIGPLMFNNALRYQEDDLSEKTNERLTDSLSVRGRWSKLFWRASMDYSFKPLEQVEEYSLNLDYQHSNRLNTQLTLDHKPEKNFTETRLSATYSHDKFRFTPFIELDSDDELYAGANLRFGLVDNPDAKKPYLTGQSLVNKGVVSSLVFLDVNGNLKFDGNDTVLEDVYVETYPIKRRVGTNDSGLAIIDNIAAYSKVDVKVDKTTLPEAHMIVRNEGHSIIPGPGDLYRFSFPVHYAGEIDGSVYSVTAQGQKKYLKYETVKLMPFDNKASQPLYSKTAMDGFFVTSLIPPGRYFLTVDESVAKNSHAGRPPPKIITVGYGGDILYGQDIVLRKGAPDVGFGVINAAAAAEMGLAPVSDRDQVQPEYFIRIENEKSSFLLSALYRLKIKRLANEFLSSLRKVITADEAGQKIERYWIAGNSLEKAYSHCLSIAAEGVPCMVEAALPPEQADKNLELSNLGNEADKSFN